MTEIRGPRSNRGQGGFTLIELLVVVAILAVLSGAVIIGVGALRGNAQEQTCKVDRETLETAAEAYRTSNGAFPATIQELVDSGLVKAKTGANNPVANFTIDPSNGQVTVVAGSKYGSVAASCNTD